MSEVSKTDKGNWCEVNLSELFPAYSGEVLTVSDAFHARMKRLFPEIDLASYYRSMDSYLMRPETRKPKNIQSFLLKNAKKEKSCTLRNVESWRKKQEATERELAVGRLEK